MPPVALTSAELSRVLVEAASKTGGWAYSSGKSSRIETTCWAMLALAQENSGSAQTAAYEFLVSCRRADGLLSDRSDLPTNTAWTALALVTLSALSPSADDDFRQRLLAPLLESGGQQLKNNPALRQNNQLKGWPWTLGTFSWAEPTSWCVMALKKSVQMSPAATRDPLVRRIAEGEAVLIDRVCDSGGWNYGNSNVLGKSLPAHVPTTALGLIALQDRRGLPAVQRSLAFIEEHWKKELSGTALALSLICLRIYDRPTGDVETALVNQWQRTAFLGNLATTAMACCALNMNTSAIAPLTLPS